MLKMKEENMKTKKFLCLLLLIGICVVFQMETISAEVANDRFYEGEYIYGTYYKKVKNGVGRYETARFLNRSDGEFVYCLQPFIEFVNGELQTAYDEDYALVTGLTEEQWSRIALLAYYGYQYRHHTDSKWYAITQLLIWKTVDPNSDIYFTDTLDGNQLSLYASEIKELEQLIFNHELYPDFGNQKMILSPEQTIVLTDNHHVLNQFSVNHDTDIFAQISGNQLIITAKYYGNYQINLVKKDSLYAIPPIVYVAEEGQDVFTVGSYPPLQKQITIEVAGGRIRLKKVDRETTIAQGDASLMGAIYEVYDQNQNLISTLYIDENQTAETDLLSYGLYTIKEVKSSTGYHLNPKIYEVELASDYANIVVEEDVIKGNIQITKLDSKTGICKPQGEASLAGAVYGIYNSSNVLVDQVTIGTDCIGFSKKLPYGIYDIRELTSSKGYYVSGELHSVYIQEEKTYSVISKEPIIENEFEIYKFYGIVGTEKIRVEPNAIFELIDYNNQVVTTITTNENGYAKIKLPYGNYRLHQVSGVKGYELLDNFLFQVNETSRNLQIYYFHNGISAAKLKVIKIDSNTKKTLSKAKFKIKNLDTNTYICQTIDETICEFETNEEGFMITPFPLEIGNYLLEEIEAPNGYLLSKPVHFSIRKNDASFIEDDFYGPLFQIVYENTPIVGQIEISKLGEKIIINEDTFIYSSIPLDKVQYGIYNQEGILVEILITNTEGYAKSNFLPLGIYYLKEIKTSNQHVLDETEYLVELSSVDPNTPIIFSKVSFQNRLAKGNLWIQKVDTETKLGIANTKIAIYTEEGICIHQGVTDADGKLFLSNLWMGKFYIEEVESAEGYQLRKEKIYFTIEENDETVEIMMENEKIGEVVGVHKEIEVPDTLLVQHNYLDIFSIFYFAGSIFILIYGKN